MALQKFNQELVIECFAKKILDLVTNWKVFWCHLSTRNQNQDFETSSVLEKSGCYYMEQIKQRLMVLHRKLFLGQINLVAKLQRLRRALFGHCLYRQTKKILVKTKLSSHSSTIPMKINLFNRRTYLLFTGNLHLQLVLLDLRQVNVQSRRA